MTVYLTKTVTILPCRYVLARGGLLEFLTNLGWLCRGLWTVDCGLWTVEETLFVIASVATSRANRQLYDWDHMTLPQLQPNFLIINLIPIEVLQNWSYWSELWQSFQCTYVLTPRNAITKLNHTEYQCVKKKVISPIIYQLVVYSK